MGRDRAYPGELTDAMRSNAKVTVQRANALLERFGESRLVTSGWRPVSLNNQTPGAAARSKHITCEAIDLADPDGDLDDWCMEHLEDLAAIGCWLEHPASTKNWCHLQIVPPKSQRRVFYP